ncbi:MAG: hypothetical protein AAF598_08330 [Bacteroidota bacterium]
MKDLLLLAFLISIFSCTNGEYQSPINPDPSITPETASAEATALPYSEDASLQLSSLINAENQMIDQGLLNNGRKHGAWLNYTDTYNRQNLNTVYNYIDGTKHGPYLIMDNGASLKETGTYYEGQLHGTRTVFARGKIVETVNFQKGQLHGLTTRFYDDGKTKKEEGNYLNGKRDGIHKWFDQEGQVIIEYTYKDGEQVK